MNDKLDHIFFLREEFMRAINEKFPDSAYPLWPVDPGEKQNQKAIRATTLKGIEEVWEALAHLKNWKSHKQNGSKEFDREEFLEEFVDAFNYFLAVLIMLGIDSSEFIEAFKKKNQKIHNRLYNNY